MIASAEARVTADDVNSAPRVHRDAHELDGEGVLPWFRVAVAELFDQGVSA